MGDYAMPRKMYDTQEVVNKAMFAMKHASTMDELSSSLRLCIDLISQLSENNRVLTIVSNVAEVLFDKLESDDIEFAVHECLRFIGEATNTDRVQNWKNEVIDGELHFVLYEEWMSELGAKCKPVPKKFTYPYHKVPGWEDMFRLGQSINAPIEKLRPIEQELLAPFGMKSIVLTPLFLAGELWGFFSVDDCKEPRIFNEEELAILNSVGFMLVSALEQFRMMRDIQKRDYLLDTVHRVATLLLDTEMKDMRANLNISLRMLMEAIDADRASIWKYAPDTDRMSCVIRISNPGYEIVSEAPYEYFEDESIKLKNNITYNCILEDIPEEERVAYIALGIQTTLSIPIFLKGNFWGCLGFENCHHAGRYPEQEIAIIHSVGLMIANGLQRNEYIRSIEDTTQKLEIALDEAHKASNVKSDFLANMSHEMRTPLNAIIGLSELAMEENSGSTLDLQNMEKIYASGNHLLRLVNDILDISKIEAGKLDLDKDNYDLASVLNDVININIIRVGEKPIIFRLNISEDLPINLYGDDRRIRQIMSNLLSNAFKYTEEGVVELEVSGQKHESMEDHIWITIRVKDTGSGIKEEDIEHLFTDYTRTSIHRSQEGTGLGLSITKQLTEMMHGTVTAESVYQEGSVFTATILQKVIGDRVIGKEVVENLQKLRYTDDKHRRVADFLRIPLPYAKVLVVDDNLTNLYVFQGILQPYKMRVDCALSGMEAIEAIRDEKIQYDAIFMDHMMPEMDGIEATRIIREEIGTEYAQTIPIIACTANAIVGNKKMFLRNGFQAFLSKPIDITSLDHILRQWVRDKDQEKTKEYKAALKQHKSTLISRREDSKKQNKSMDVSDYIGEEFQSLSHSIQGIDIDKGIKIFDGSYTEYVKFLKYYANDTQSHLDHIRGICYTICKTYKVANEKKHKCPFKEAPNVVSLSDYAIIVHGIKGASFWIGANEIGDLAEKLEHASLNGDYMTILELHPTFAMKLNQLIEEINAYVELGQEEVQSIAREDVLHRLLVKLYHACHHYRMDDVDDVIAEIENRPEHKEHSLVEWLQENILHMNFQEIKDKIQSLVQMDHGVLEKGLIHDDI